MMYFMFSAIFQLYIIKIYSAKEIIVKMLELMYRVINCYRQWNQLRVDIFFRKWNQDPIVKEQMIPTVGEVSEY